MATCNTVGQTAGYFVGNVVFLTLESADFCNKYIHSQHETHGLITLAGLLLHLYDSNGAVKTRRCSQECISPPSEFLQTPSVGKFLRGHARTVPGSMDGNQI